MPDAELVAGLDRDRLGIIAARMDDIVRGYCAEGEPTDIYVAARVLECRQLAALCRVVAKGLSEPCYFTGTIAPVCRSDGANGGLCQACARRAALASALGAVAEEAKP